MIAKYAGQCALTGQPFIVGETEIGKLGTKWVLAEYADTEKAAAYATERLQEALALATRAGHATDLIEKYLVEMAELQPIAKPIVRPDMGIMAALKEAREAIEAAREDLGE